jgi:DNA-binding transcriptional LysR family regulator
MSSRSGAAQSCSRRRRAESLSSPASSLSIWPAVGSNVRASDGETLRQLALTGAGLARFSRFHVQADLDSGRLLAVLEQYNPQDVAPIHAVYLGKPDRLPSRVR